MSIIAIIFSSSIIGFEQQKILHIFFICTNGYYFSMKNQDVSSEVIKKKTCLTIKSFYKFIFQIFSAIKTNAKGILNELIIKSFLLNGRKWNEAPGTVNVKKRQQCTRDVIAHPNELPSPTPEYFHRNFVDKLLKLL